MARPRPWRCCITDGADEAALGVLAAAAAAGADLIQIRAKALAPAPLLAFCRADRAACRATGALMLLNDRLDLALAAGLDGVHLPAAGLPAAAVRARVGGDFLIGRSCHTLAEVADSEGADFLFFGPVFFTPSKAGWGPPLGLEALRHAAASPIPVFALGGVNSDNANACLAAGAAGLAAIRWFGGASLAGTSTLQFP
ncbi:MAG: thiamine phosphate synthase [Terriglobales bacterium]